MTMKRKIKLDVKAHYCTVRRNANNLLDLFNWTLADKHI